MEEKFDIENMKVYSLTTEMKIVIFAVQKLLKQYPNNKGKVYVSNINIFFKDKRNIKKIDKKFGRQFECTKEQIEIIIERLDEIGIVHKHIGPRGATYVTLDDEAYIKYFHLEPPVGKELLVSKVLMRLNGRCAIHTISDILIQDKSSYDDIDPLYWLDNYFTKRRVILDDKELNGLVGGLI